MDAGLNWSLQYMVTGEAKITLRQIHNFFYKTILAIAIVYMILFNIKIELHDNLLDNCNFHIFAIPNK